MNPLLGYTPPRFSRRMWVSDAARSVWETKLIEGVETWRQIEWLTVVLGVRDACIVSLSHEEHVALARAIKRHGLFASTLSVNRHIDRLGEKSARYRVAVCTRKTSKDLRLAWSSMDSIAVGEMLGYPQCCCIKYSIGADAERGLLRIWEAARASGRFDADKMTIETDAIPELNPFWRGIGIQMIPHMPCSLRCEASRKLAIDFNNVARDAQYGDIMDNTRTILSWPVHWSLLHGVVQIRTPILKMSNRGAPVSIEHTIKWRSREFPKEGARALAAALLS